MHRRSGEAGGGRGGLFPRPVLLRFPLFPQGGVLLVGAAGAFRVADGLNRGDYGYNSCNTASNAAPRMSVLKMRPSLSNRMQVGTPVIL